jgi:hypothetical protein
MFSFNNITFNSTFSPKSNNETHDNGGFPYSMLALIIPIGLILLMALCICLCECISNYQRMQWTIDTGSSLHSSFYEGGISFTPKPNIFFIKGMTQFIVKDSEKMNDKCSICIEDYRTNDKIVRLSCGHEFHKDCIHPWFRQQVEGDIYTYCPMCKQKQVVEYRAEITEMDLEDGLMIEKV